MTKQKAFFNLAFLLLASAVSAQRTPRENELNIPVNEDSIQATILLIGDAGQLTNGRQPVIDAARKEVQMNKKTTVLFLGDNLYKTGLPDDMVPTYEIAKAPLDSQITIAGKSPVNVFFIPGNHDWANGGSLGYQSILRVQQYIDELGNKYVRQLPRDGCPGPEEIDVNDDVVLLLLDSQWWLQTRDKPGVESDCPYKTKAEVIAEINDILNKNDKKLVLFATHHPMRSYGPHGGYFTLKQHLFPFTDINPKLYIPLPVLGSLYPLTRAVFGTEQDLKQPAYQDMITQFENAVKGHPNVIFVSGHEHTLQFIRDSSYNYIVSGSGSKSDRVSYSRNSLFASSNNGFATIRVSKNKTVRASFYTVAGDSVKEAYSKNILDFSHPKELKPIGDTMRTVDYVYKDSVALSASDKYKRHNSALKNLILGTNYRQEWSTPVLFKEFNLNKEQGGFKISGLGGGKQTKSLKLVDKTGKEWTLRTVDKDPDKAIPENFRGTVGEALVVDMVSASNPYAPYTIPDLSKAAGVPAATPRYFYVPDDPAFGYYRPLFANTVCMLEEKIPIPGVKDTKSTSKMLSKIYENNDDHVDGRDVLRARLLDMFIGDFDRHADQWSWAKTDTGKGKLYYPVPKDRDQAYFNSNGLFLKILSKKQMPFLQGFKSRITNINGLNYVARDFDRSFLNQLDKSQWQAITDTFVRAMTDDVFKTAASKYPPEIKRLDSAWTVDKLIGRRKDFAAQSMKYYKFLAKRVTVIGSNNKELFHFENADGQLKLSVYTKTKDSDSASLMYRRTFNRKETKELVVYGLNDNDKFVIDPNVNSKIRLRIVGGKGDDTFDLRGNIRNTLYDLNTEKNLVINHRRTDNDFSSSVSVLDYSPIGFQYNSFSFPNIDLGYNVEDGVLAGLGFTSKTYGFRKDPYATYQKFSTLEAIGKNAFRASYTGVFNRSIAKNDVLVNGTLEAPTLNNFFGFGNNTAYDKSKPMSYYRSRYKFVTGNVLVRKRVNDIISVSAGPYYYRYSSDPADNTNRLISKPATLGLDSTTLFQTKQYLGGLLKADINYVNNEVFPTRGITWYNSVMSLAAISGPGHNYSEWQSDMTVYAQISDLSKVSGVFRVGGGSILNKNFEYFQAKTIGFNSYLRGYRRDRFAGRSMAYGSAEVRFRLFRSHSYLLPGDFGLLGFTEIGRVWQPGENSGRWHPDYGAGFYFLPFSAVAIEASFAQSPEDGIFSFSLGTKFNLNF